MKRLEMFDRFLLILLSMLISVSMLSPLNCHASKPEPEERPSLMHASNPICSIGGIAGASIAGAGVVAGASTIITGIVLQASGIGFKAGLALTTAGTASVVGLAYGSTLIAMYLACRYSFVRHPVLYYKQTGEYKECANPVLNKYSEQSSQQQQLCVDFKYKKATDYEWPKNGNKSSDYIEVCHRNPLGGLGSAVMDPREEEIAKKYPTSLETSLITSKRSVGGDLRCKRLKAGEKTSIHNIVFQAQETGDKICASTYSFNKGVAFWPSFTIGCHLKEPGPPAPMCKSSVAIFGDDKEIKDYDNSSCFSCFISEACYSQTGLVAKAQLPMTSLVVQCIKESLNNILAGDCLDPITLQQKPNFLNTAKERLGDAVKAIVLLAVILFIFKAAMGGVQGQSEYILLVMKISFVLYFGLGDGIAFYYGELNKLSVGLSDLVLGAGGNETVCNYRAEDYFAPVLKKGAKLDQEERDALRKIYKEGNFRDFQDVELNKQKIANGLSEPQFNAFLNKIEFKSFSYIAPWDRLDCRLMFYLGSSVKSFAGVGTVGAVAVVASAPVAIAIILISAAIFGGNFIIAICVFFFLVMIILTIIWMVHLFILSMIAITILALFAPIFLPMMLFQVTKGFFDGWLKEIIAYSLYPIVLFTFLALVFSVFDTLYFGDLKFKQVVITDNKNTKTTYGYVIDPESQCDTEKGRITLACLVEGIKFISKPLVFGINVTATEDEMGDSSKSIWKGFAKMGLMGFLFYHFLGLIGGLAAELSGSFRADVGQASSTPGAMASKLASVGKQVASGANKAGNKARSALSNKSKGGEDKASAGDSGQGNRNG